MSDTVKMTQAARDRLEEKVEQLEGEARREAAVKIGTARAEGDLKENAEYHAAKDDAAMLEAKIAHIREQLRAAEIVEFADGDAAGMGSTVTYEDDGKKLEFTLVPSSEADPAKGSLSIDSPMGRALAGAQAGDERTLETPKGPREVRILSVANG